MASMLFQRPDLEAPLSSNSSSPLSSPIPLNAPAGFFQGLFVMQLFYYFIILIY